MEMRTGFLIGTGDDEVYGNPNVIRVIMLYIYE